MKLSQLATLLEGGFAMKDAGVGRITKDDIPATVQLVSKMSGIPTNDLQPLGSVGKMPTSGDIDLAVDTNKYNPEEIHAKMEKALGPEKSTFNKGTKVASYAFPVAGDESKGMVQVDLMFVDNTKWADFAYHSPGETSQYKGAIRSILLMGIASTLNDEGSDYFHYDPETNDMTIRAGRTLDLNAGIRRIYQYLPKNKRTGAYLKNKKTIKSEEFAEMFPDVELKNGNLTIDDPKKVLAILFGGKDVKPTDVSSAEQVLALIKNKFSPERQEDILKAAGKRLKGVQGKMDIPPELQEYI